MNLFAPAVAVAALAASSAAAQPAGLDFLAGRYAIEDPAGKVIGSATITVRQPGAMLEEERMVGEGAGQKLWFGRLEHTGGWTQLFLSPGGLREFPRLSADGVWPMVFGAPVVLANGGKADFRLTVTRTDWQGRSHRRLLESSSDGGASWKTVLDYRYVAVAG